VADRPASQAEFWSSPTSGSRRSRQPSPDGSRRDPALRRGRGAVTPEAEKERHVRTIDPPPQRIPAHPPSRPMHRSHQFDPGSPVYPPQPTPGFPTQRAIVQAATNQWPVAYADGSVPAPRRGPGWSPQPYPATQHPPATSRKSRGPLVAVIVVVLVLFVGGAHGPRAAQPRGNPVTATVTPAAGSRDHDRGTYDPAAPTTPRHRSPR